MTEAGILYLCATPIGNLEDITPRVLRILSEADIIAAEDTRHTLQLLNHFNIKGHLVRYDEHSKDKNGPKLIAELLDGKNVALVSDAGFPGIADPGEQLAREAIDAGIKVVPLPGANAALCALIASGLPSSPFFFGGFLPKSKKNRAEQLAAWKNIPSTIILYEAPHRIKDVLKEILAAWGDRQLAAARELTKLHEEFFRGSVTECLAWLEAQPPRGRRKHNRLQNGLFVFQRKIQVSGAVVIGKIGNFAARVNVAHAAVTLNKRLYKKVDLRNR